MAIPDYQTVMLPLLRLLEDGQEHSMQETVDGVSDHFDLSAEDRKEPLPSGSQEVIHNRVGWAKTYMVKAGLIASVRRGSFRITDEGAKVLASNPPKIDVKFLEQLSVSTLLEGDLVTLIEGRAQRATPCLVRRGEGAATA